MNKITVLGDGAWGTAIAAHLAAKSYPVTLWCYNKSVADSINNNHKNQQFLPDITLPTNITAITDLETAIKGASWILECVPVKFMREIIEATKPFVRFEQKWAVLSKGIENDTLLFSSQIIEDIIGDQVKIAAISGPSFAADLALQQPTAVMIASKDTDLSQELKQIMQASYFKAEVTQDIIGVQACAAVKNIVAIATGMLNASGYTDNTKAMLITCALNEMAKFCEFLGGYKETAYGLAGVGDLMLTALGQRSKNLALGTMLGQNKTVKEIEAHYSAMPEGINTVIAIDQLCRKHKISLPLFNSVYEIIFNNKTITYLLNQISF